MAKSVRFDRKLEAMLEEAAEALGISQSKLIREAIAEKCREILRPPLSQSLAPFIGRVNSKGGRARNTGVAFTRALLRKGAR